MPRPAESRWAEFAARVQRIWPHHRRLHEALPTWYRAGDDTSVRFPTTRAEDDVYREFHLGLDGDLDGDLDEPETGVQPAEHDAHLWTRAELELWRVDVPVDIVDREPDHLVVRRTDSGLLIKVDPDFTGERLPLSGWRPHLLRGWRCLVSGPDSNAQARIYLNVKRQDRLEAFKQTALGLHAQGLSFQAKIAARVDSARPDAIVVYVAEADVARVLRVVHAAAPLEARPAAAAGFGTPLAPGVALGYEGPELGGLSYGQFCARTILRAVAAWRNDDPQTADQALSLLEDVVPQGVDGV